MMNKELTEDEALKKAAAYCAKSEHCRDDVMKKLQSWGIAPATSAEIVARLTDEHFIDEERYAGSFARDKFRFASWGRTKIAYELQMRHIADTHIAKGLAAIDNEEYEERLQSLLEKKRQSIKDESNRFETYGKLMRYALSKGYEPELIKKHLPDAK